jgi:hypothetical protein
VSGFLRAYVTLVVVVCVVVGLATAFVAAGQVLRPQPRARRVPDSDADPGADAEAASAPGAPRSVTLPVAAAVCGVGVLLAPWAAAAGTLSWGAVAVGLVAVALLAVGAAAALR